MRDVSIPKARASAETHAYSLEEIMRMLVVIPPGIAPIVAAAAFTGARQGRAQGIPVGELRRGADPDYSVGLEGSYR